jgi:hypothetical protein
VSTTKAIKRLKRNSVDTPMVMKWHMRSSNPYSYPYPYSTRKR